MPARTGREKAIFRLLPLALVLAMFSLPLIAVTAAPQAQPPPDTWLAESTVRAAITAWAYAEYWRLYAMGTTESRAALSEKDFADQMQKGSRKPGIGLEILEAKIAGSQALIQAKVRMEYGKYAPYARTRPPVAGSADEAIQVMLVYQEGEWRVNLYQFVGMSGY